MNESMREPRALTIAVLFGGPSAEHEVSLLSARNILRALSEDREKRRVSYKALAIGITRQRHWLLLKNWEKALSPPPKEKLPRELSRDMGAELAFLPGAEKALCLRQDKKLLETLSIDLFFPLVHGPYGEDGSLQGLLEQLGFAYVGSGVSGSAIAMDKDLMKTFLKGKVELAEYLSFQKYPSCDKEKVPSFEALVSRLGLPFYVKAASQGSSLGVHRVNKKEEFQKALTDAFGYSSKIIIEKNIEGRELECAVLGNAEPQASLVGEIIPQKCFYSYDAKYTDEKKALLRMPSELSSKEEAHAQKTALKVFKILGLAGMARIDMFLDTKGKLWINEVNSVPGFTNISMYPGLWEKSGLDLFSLLDRLITLGREKHEQKRQLRLKPEINMGSG